MPKSSRRKKAKRQHAVRKGERYERIPRSSATGAPEAPQAPPSNATAEAVHVALGSESLREVQRLVELRGWVVVGPFDLDQYAMVSSSAVMWDYAPAFGGVELPDEDEDVVPLKPSLSFEGEWIVVGSAGNWCGCDQHRGTSRRSPLSAAGIAALPPLLDEVEASSRSLDPAPFIDCLADGPCAVVARQRERQLGRADLGVGPGPFD